MHGAMGWIEPRTKIMILTEPIYYFGTLLAQKNENNFTTFADMKGHSVGTVTGFTLVPELKAVEASARSSSTTPPTASCRISSPAASTWRCSIRRWCNTPSSSIRNGSCSRCRSIPEPDKYPIMSTKYNVIFGINKNEPELAEAINGVIGRPGPIAST